MLIEMFVFFSRSWRAISMRPCHPVHCTRRAAKGRRDINGRLAAERRQKGREACMMGERACGPDSMATRAETEARAREAASFKCHEAPLGPGPHQGPDRAPSGFAQAAEGTRGRGPQKSFIFRPQLATGSWCGALALPWAWPWADGGAPGGARAELGSESGYRITVSSSPGGP